MWLRPLSPLNIEPEAASVAWMERSGIRDNTVHGVLPACPHSRRNLFLHRHALRSAVASIDRAHRCPVEGIPIREAAISLFRIDALVVIPDHLHTVWALAEGDDDFSRRWRAIKSRFTRVRGGIAHERDRRGEYALATALLGTPDLRRRRLWPPHRLHSLQSGETWVSRTACGRALVIHSPIYSDPGQVERLAGELATMVEHTLKSAA